MRLLIASILFSLVAFSFAQDDFDGLFTTPDTNFLEEYEQVETQTLGSLEAFQKCGEDNGTEMKRCVPYYNCDGRTNSIIKSGKFDGLGLIDIRFGQNSCDSYLDVCCKVPPDDDDQEIIPNIKPTTPETVTEPDDKKPTSKGNFCGIRNEEGIDFRISGSTNEAQFAEFPWMVEILNKKYNVYNETLAVCGGSLITPIVILTGAHCVHKYKPGELKVRAGEWDTMTTRERLPYQERDVDQIIIHESFNKQNLKNDVALLILSQPYRKAKNLGTICLPPQGQRISSEHFSCFATGWGKDLFGKEGRYQTILKKVDLPIVPNSLCQEYLRKTRLGKHFILDDSFICAGGEAEKDTCTGDGGGPLVCPDPDNPSRYVQAGIVAWGISCGQDQIPGVYVDVSKFREWVDLQMKRLNFDTRPYYI